MKNEAIFIKILPCALRRNIGLISGYQQVQDIIRFSLISIKMIWNTIWWIKNQNYPNCCITELSTLNPIQQPQKIPITEIQKPCIPIRIRVLSYNLSNTWFLCQKVDWYIFMNANFYYENAFSYPLFMGKFTRMNEK